MVWSFLLLSLCMSLSHPPILLSQVPSSCSSVSEQKGSSTRECLTQGCSLLLAELTEEPGSPYSTALGQQCVPNRAVWETLFVVAGAELREVMAFCQADTAALWSSQQSPLCLRALATVLSSDCFTHVWGFGHHCSWSHSCTIGHSHSSCGVLAFLDVPLFRKSPWAPHWSWRALLLIVPAPGCSPQHISDRENLSNLFQHI